MTDTLTPEEQMREDLSEANAVVPHPDQTGWLAQFQSSSHTLSLSSGLYHDILTLAQKQHTTPEGLISSLIQKIKQ